VRNIVNRMLSSALICTTLLLAGCQSNGERATAFLQLCKFEQPDKIEIALKKSGNADIAGEDGVTGLMVAAAQNRSDVVKLLLAGGGDVKKQTHLGATALMFAVARGSSAELVEMLLAAGSDVNAKDASGNTPLILAAGDAIEIAEDYATILDLKPSQDAKENKAVDSDGDNKQKAEDDDEIIQKYPGAHKKNEAQLLSLLLAKGADVNAGNTSGITAFITAADPYRSGEGISLLAQAKADVNAHSSGGTTALMTAVVGDNLPAMQAIIKAKSDVNQQDKEGWTALMIAAVQDNLPALNALIKAGARVSDKNIAGATALGMSSGDTRKLLIKLGGDPKEQARWMAETDLDACIKIAKKDHFSSLMASKMGIPNPGSLRPAYNCPEFGELRSNTERMEDTTVLLSGAPVTVDYYGVKIRCTVIENKSSCEK
jgi:ankyrin repeat protein